MRHIFVINPKAGKVNRVEEISNHVKKYDGKLDYEIYSTQSRGDAAKFVKQYLNTHDAKEIYRFYACGGDGTLHDVANGACGHKNAEVACLACGSGNDFIKYFDNLDEFRQLDDLIKAEARPIDAIKVNDLVCINILSFGFDAEVTFTMHDYKRKPLITGKMAYTLAALHCLLFKMKFKMKVTADDKVLFDGNGLLCAVANGSWYGGGFHCAPLAKVDDGLMDICLARCVSRAKSPMLMGIFKKGNHLEDKRLKDTIIYTKCKKVVIESDAPVAYQVDGETYRVPKLDVEIIPNGLNFVVPVHEDNK